MCNAHLYHATVKSGTALDVTASPVLPDEVDDVSVPGPGSGGLRQRVLLVPDHQQRYASHVAGLVDLFAQRPDVLNGIDRKSKRSDTENLSSR